MRAVDLLISGGTLVDPASGRHGRFDVAVTSGRVTEVAPDLGSRRARRVVDATGKYVFPGLVDMHVHLAGEPAGYRMLIRAGVTCALDMAARPETVLPELLGAGRGLSVGFLFPLTPGGTVSGRDPGDRELSAVIDKALDRGALGVKVLGGHYPLTPDATARIVRLAHDKRCWCAVHAGTTATGSNIDGLEEILTLADGQPVHVAHVNSYCRGQQTGDPLREVSRALKALAAAPSARSESYLARINGTSAAMVEGVPASEATKTCLGMGGFPASAEGMEAAIASGWAQVNDRRRSEVVLLSPKAGLRRFLHGPQPVRVSFPVNHPAAAIALATAKQDGEFLVDALSTDGGAIPRNVTLEKGLALVRFGALSLEEFVRKACLNPARLLGAPAKGHLGVGADADAIVVDLASALPEVVVVDGRLAYSGGKATGGKGRLITTTRGCAFAETAGLQTVVSEPTWLG